MFADVIAKLTPDFCHQLRTGLVSVHATALADSILISNIRDADQRAQLMRQLRLSREWKELTTAAEKKCAAPEPEKRQAIADALEVKLEQIPE